MNNLNLKKRMKMNLQTLTEYIKIHKISMEQDLANVDGADYMLPYLEGAIAVSNHYLDVLTDE